MAEEQEPPREDLPPLDTEPALNEAAGLPPSPPETPQERVTEFETLEDMLRSSPALPTEETAGPTADLHSAENTDSLTSLPIDEDLTPAPEPKSELAPDSYESPPASPPPPSDPLSRIKEFSDTVVPAHSPVPAAFPFSLRIEGKISDSEREKLVAILAKEDMGIREIDLQPQFEAGHLLLPRISEYAGILVLQALRDSLATFRLGPSDTIYSTEQTQEPFDSTANPVESTLSVLDESEARIRHLAESIPIIAGGELPGTNEWTVIDGVSATAVLQARVVEVTRSPGFEEMVEALQRELRFKAFRRGATAILNYDLKLIPLAVPTQYRVIATGTAIQHTTSHQDLPNA